MNLQPREEWNRWVHRFGILSNLALLLSVLSFPVAVSLIEGVWPDLVKLLPAFIAVFLFMIPWAPAETIGFMPIMGPGALYMSYITGNITNLKMPATVGTINSLEIEPNSDECHTIAIIACGASVITVMVIIAFGVVLAVPLKPVLESPVLKPAFDYVVPAIFGGLVAQTIFKNKIDSILYLIPLCFCLVCSYMTSLNGAYYMLIAIVMAGGLRVLYYYKKERKQEKVTLDE